MFLILKLISNFFIKHVSYIFLLKFDFDIFIIKQLIYFKVFATRIQKNKKKQFQNKTKKIEIVLKINKTIKTKNFVIKIFDNKFEKYFDDN